MPLPPGRWQRLQLIVDKIQSQAQTQRLRMVLPVHLTAVKEEQVLVVWRQLLPELLDVLVAVLPRAAGEVLERVRHFAQLAIDAGQPEK